MAVKKQGDKWLADVNSRRHGRKQKLFTTKAQADKWEYQTRYQYTGKPKPDVLRLSDLAVSWFDLHGHSLKSGERRKTDLLNLAKRLGNPLASKFTTRDFGRYRSDRLKQVSKNTVNHEHAYLRSMFNELKRLGEWEGANPLDNVRQYRIERIELSALSQDQIANLIEQLKVSNNPHALPVAMLCLATGARWTEAEGLQARYLEETRVTFPVTKGGKPRSVPIAPALGQYLRGFVKRSSYSSGKIFKSCYAAFGKALERTGIELPKGQRSHVLRHTFASEFVARGGSLAVLQKVLGHSDISMTMRYAHLSPDHLQSAVLLNPCGEFVESLPPAELSAESKKPRKRRVYGAKLAAQPRLELGTK